MEIIGTRWYQVVSLQCDGEEEDDDDDDDDDSGADNGWGYRLLKAMESWGALTYKLGLIAFPKLSSNL